MGTARIQALLVDPALGSARRYTGKHFSQQQHLELSNSGAPHGHMAVQDAVQASCQTFDKHLLSLSFM